MRTVGPGVCDTCRAAMPIVATSAGIKRTGEWGTEVLQDHERVVQPLVIQQVSVKQQEPKQASSKVTQLFCFSRMLRRTQ